MSAGGILCGLAGLSGPLLTMWATLRGWTKDQRRSFFQTYNLIVLAAACVVFALSGLATAQAGLFTLIALPGTVIGSLTGAFVSRCRV